MAICEAGEEAEGCSVGHLTCPRAGYQFAREIQLSPSARAVVVSFLHEGGVFVFGPDGTLSASQKTAEIGSFQVFDFDHDGTDELITEEQDTEGTGVEVRTYRVYRVGSTALEQLWEGLSYSFDGNVQPPEQRQGFIRFADAGSGGDPHARLVYLEGGANSGHFTQRVFAMSRGTFHERKGLTEP